MKGAAGDRAGGKEAIKKLTAKDDERVLREVVRRIVEVAAPERIVLFGSAARGTPPGPDSDLDLLVIKEGAHRRRLAQDIYRNLAGVGRAVDVVVVTPDDIERYGKNPALVIEPALREGRPVYDASSSSRASYFGRA